MGRRFGHTLGWVAVVALAGACASRGPTFDFRQDRLRDQQIEREYAPYRQRGSASIRGRAWMDFPGGRREVASRRQVQLTPVTSISRQFIDEAMTSGEWGTQVLARDRAVVWTTRSDEKGVFTFSMLPAGRYYVIFTAGWTDATGQAHETILVTETQVADGEQRDLLLAGKPPPAP